MGLKHRRVIPGLLFPVTYGFYSQKLSSDKAQLSLILSSLTMAVDSGCAFLNYQALQLTTKFSLILIGLNWSRENVSKRAHRK